MSNSLRIKSVTVKGLFNQFDHHIDFNQDERITILHGINGVGKTTILRMINNLFSFRIYSFDKIPFNFFIVNLSNNNQIKIEKKQSENSNSIELYINKDKIDLQDFDTDLFIKQNPWVNNSYKDTFFDNESNVPLSLEELIESYKEIFPSNIFKKEELNSKYIPIQFIEASRLFHIDEQYNDYRSNAKAIIFTIKSYATELQQHIKTAMANYAKKSQELEQTFPFRLLESVKHPDKKLKEYTKERIVGLQNKRQELREMRLLPTTDSTPLDESSIDSLEEDYAQVMNLYVKDSEEKLAVLENLSKKIKLLLKIINAKFQGKELRIDENKGLIIVSKNGEIDLTLLSSGEQHELVMFYDLIFKVAPNTLVMIDEPELSLHITWQNKFINELKEIVEQAKFDVLIATHSATIVGNNSHLMVGLSVKE